MSLEWVAAAAMGVLAVAAFALQLWPTAAPHTAREDALFSTLQFFLTLGFGWFSTRAISRLEFEQSMKRFAISAYRRVSDIERIVGRLNQQVRQMLESAESKESANLRVVSAIVADTAHVVKSSGADWADVIGDELLAVERIKQLAREKEVLQVDAASGVESTPGKLIEIERGIERLLATLPPRLQLDAQRDDRTDLLDNHAVSWMRRMHEQQGGLRMTVVTGELYGSKRDHSTLQPNEELVVVADSEGGLDVADSTGAILGRLQNNSPLDYDAFVRAISGCFGPAPYRVNHVRDLGSSIKDGEKWGWFEVRWMATSLAIGEDASTSSAKSTASHN